MVDVMRVVDVTWNRTGCCSRILGSARGCCKVQETPVQPLVLETGRTLPSGHVSGLQLDGVISQHCFCFWRLFGQMGKESLGSPDRKQRERSLGRKSWNLGFSGCFPGGLSAPITH